MALREIVLWPDARLATVCDPVAPGEDIGALIRDLFETMYGAQGRGLAAPQIGVMKRVFVMDCTWKEGARSPVVCVNPRIVATSQDIGSSPEGCLSIPGILVDVERPDWVVLAWTDGDGNDQNRRLAGIQSRCAQHELDHLDGIVTFLRLPDVARTSAGTGYLAP